MIAAAWLSDRYKVDVDMVSLANECDTDETVFLRCYFLSFLHLSTVNTPLRPTLYEHNKDLYPTTSNPSVPLSTP